MPLISVIIPTCHRNDLLAKCLDCLAPGVQTLPPEQYEVIVTDDGSRTTARQLVQDSYSWAHWTEGPRRGPAANRNNGAGKAQSEWLAFTDDDCLPEAGWLSALAAAMNGEALALEGAIHPLGDMNQDLAECPVNLTGGYFWSANIAIQRSLFQQIEGFDPEYLFAAHEDQDIKIRLEGLTNITFAPEAIVLHPVRVVSLSSFITTLRRRCAAWALHVNKHWEKLGYAGKPQFCVSQYKFYSKSILLNFRKKKFCNVISSIIMILVGVPLILHNLHVKNR